MDLLKNLDNMITAEELLKTIYNEGSGAGGSSYNEGDIERIMIEFAKFHVERNNKKIIDHIKELYEFNLHTDILINEDDILNPYSLENIK